MAYPLAVTEQLKPELPTTEVESIEWNISPPACDFLNHWYGEASGQLVTYGDFNSFVWFSTVNTVEVNSVSITVYDLSGNVTDKILAGSALSHLIQANWTLRLSNCAYVGICGTGQLSTTRELNAQIRGTVAIYINVNQRVYLGRIIDKPVAAHTRVDGCETIVYVYQLEGLKAACNEIYTFNKSFSSLEVSEAVKVLAAEVASKTNINYDAGKVVDTGVNISLQEFSAETVLSAIDKLAAVAGILDWGVDVFGDLVFGPLPTDVIYHYWQENHPVELENLKSTSNHIVNGVYVETSTGTEGQKTYEYVEDTVSSSLYGLVQTMLTLDSSSPSASTTPSTYDLIRNPSDTVTDEANASDGDFATFAQIDIGNITTDNVDIEITDALAVQQLKIYQGHFTDDAGYSTHIKATYNGNEVYNQSGLNKTDVITIPLNPQSSVIIVNIEFLTAITNASGNAIFDDVWMVRELDVLKPVSSDAIQLANSHLAIYSRPFLEGSFKNPPNLFVLPQFFRFTDANGNSEKYEVEEITYSIDRGFISVASVGRGKLKFKKLIAQQKAQSEAADKRLEKSMDNLSSRVTNLGG